MTEIEQLCAQIENLNDRLLGIENRLANIEKASGHAVIALQNGVLAQKTIATLLHMHGCGRTKRDFEEYGR